MDQEFDFDKLGKVLTDVNNTIGIMHNAASLLGSAQEKALQQISALAQLCQKQQAEIGKKDMRIVELEGLLGLNKEKANGENE